MEDNVQTIIGVIIAAFIFFIFPVYMAYEKKDDISYALAIRYTQDLVDDVRSKGYITKDMYEDYRARLKVTGNSYDIQLSHEYNRYDPITNYYRIEGDKYVLVKTTTREEKEDYEKTIVQQAISSGRLTENSSDATIKAYIKSTYKTEQNIDKIEDTYKLSTEVYSTDNIINVLNSERKLALNNNSQNIVCSDDETSGDNCQYAYIMNEGDNFNITIKNTNITLATVMYNMVTANTLDTNTRIYVNYGGSILSTKWYGDIDYAKMKHDNISLTEKKEKIVFTDARHFSKTESWKNPTELIAVDNTQNDRYIIEFEVKPEDVTELREKGEIQLDNFSGYNFALGNSTANNTEDRLSISVGLNGVSLITSGTNRQTSSKTSYSISYPKTIVDSEGNEQTIWIRMNSSDYGKISIWSSAGTMHIRKYVKGTTSYNGQTYDFSNQEKEIWKDMKRIDINNPSVGTQYFSETTNGIKRTYVLDIQDDSVKITGIREQLKRQTILSYATSITDYTKIKVEFVKQDDGTYIASLYINDVKLADSISLPTLPKVDIVGKTFIGSESCDFAGYIRNVKIYEMGD